MSAPAYSDNCCGPTVQDVHLSRQVGQPVPARVSRILCFPATKLHLPHDDSTNELISVRTVSITSDQTKKSPKKRLKMATTLSLCTMVVLLICYAHGALVPASHPVHKAPRYLSTQLFLCRLLCYKHVFAVGSNTGAGRC